MDLPHPLVGVLEMRWTLFLFHMLPSGYASSPQTHRQGRQLIRDLNFQNGDEPVLFVSGLLELEPGRSFKGCVEKQSSVLQHSAVGFKGRL